MNPFKKWNLQRLNSRPQTQEASTITTKPARFPYFQKENTVLVENYCCFLGLRYFPCQSYAFIYAS